MRLRRTARAAWVVTFVACGPSLAVDPIFIEGRSVSSAADSLIAMTRAGLPGILVRRRRGGEVRELGAGTVRSPVLVQWENGQWYVSDIDTGKPAIVVLSPAGALIRRIPVERYTTTPHQFAVLPDGRIVVEAPDGTLLALEGDTSSVFTVTGHAPKTGLLIAVAGGVLHAVPDKYLTLYNQFGHIRWRLDWPWARTAYISQITLDPQGRIHVLAGVPRDSTFIVYTLSNQTGEVVIWSPPARKPTFIVDRLGQIKADNPEKWVR